MPRPLYLDCEFNGNGGHLISIALYDPKDNKEFYEVSDLWQTTVKYNEDYHGLKTWVRENVIPMLAKKAILETNIKGYLLQFLSSFEEDIIIYADWPEDFIHLLRLLYTVNPNTKVPSKLITNLKMELITTGDDFVPALPHNALSDAKTLYLNHMRDKGAKIT